MLRQALIAGALALGTAAVSTAPAEAAQAAPVRPASDIEQVCSAWDQVIPGVWAIVCLDRSGGALFQPIATVVNNSASPIAVDQFLYLNGNPNMTCGFWPNANVAPNSTMRCTNNTWVTSASPRVASATFMVNLAPLKTLTTPSFP